MDTLKHMFQTYEENVISGNASKEQIEETKTAFYSGATVMFKLMSDAAMLDKDGNFTDLERLSEELNEFTEQAYQKALSAIEGTL